LQNVHFVAGFLMTRKSLVLDAIHRTIVPAFSAVFSIPKTGMSAIFARGQAELIQFIVRIVRDRVGFRRIIEYSGIGRRLPGPPAYPNYGLPFEI